MAQSGWFKERPDNPKSSRQKMRRRQDPVGKLVKGAFLSLLLFNRRAAAFNFAPNNSTPVNITAANTTAPRPPFNITTGNLTISPWNITTSNATITPTNSTTNATTSIPTNSTNPTANAPAIPSNSRTQIQLTVANGCGESIWPGIVTQNGIGPATGGFELTPGTSRMMFVSPDWAGRIWGRTNCSFNSDGSGASTYSGVNGYGAACLTGDCFGKLNCQFAGQVPATLAEFTLQGGSTNSQTFYDISLVDGYNLPLAIIYHPAPNTTWIPPNLTNCACIASPGYLTPSSSTSPFPSPNPSDLNTNSTYPMPYEPTQTNNTLLTWCPSPLLLLQKYPPGAAGGRGSGSDLFPSADDALPRPGPGNSQPQPQSQSQSQFHPCLSPCSATHHPADCCTGRYNSPQACRPSAYSRAAKRVCPDAYSFAYDDRASTFVVPAMVNGNGGGGGGGGWEVRFCPRGRSTDILGAFGDEVRALGAAGGLSREGWGRVRDRGYVDGRWRSAAAGGLGRGGGWGVVMGVMVVVVVGLERV